MRRLAMYRERRQLLDFVGRVLQRCSSILSMFSLGGLSLLPAAVNIHETLW